LLLLLEVQEQVREAGIHLLSSSVPAPDHTPRAQRLRVGLLAPPRVYSLRGVLQQLVWLALILLSLRGKLNFRVAIVGGECEATIRCKLDHRWALPVEASAGHVATSVFFPVGADRDANLRLSRHARVVGLIAGEIELGLRR